MGGEVPQARDEEVDVKLNKRLLRPQSTGSESEKNRFLDVGVGGGIEGLGETQGHAGEGIEPLAVLEDGFGAAGRGLKDFGLGFGLRDGDGVGADAEDRAVFLVEGLHLADGGPFEDGPGKRDVEGGPGGEARDFGERVEIEVVMAWARRYKTVGVAIEMAVFCQLDVMNSILYLKS